MTQPVLLLILDGWGLREDGPGNAIEMAHATHYKHLLKTYPWIPIEASGEAVGLPDGQMGNSEVGHMNMGAGRIVYQELTRIDKSIRDGDFFENKELLAAMNHAKKTGGTLHLMGLLSDGGVHSHISHLVALIDMAKENGIENLKVHAFLDDRDVPPRSAEEYLRALEEVLLDEGFPQIATISGRYYAMDRDNRWERVEQAYHNIVMATGNHHPLSLNALGRSYNEDISDEFVLPTVTDFSYTGMNDGDSMIFFNFRPDRAREITRAFFEKDFTGFERKKVINNLHFTCMSLYDETFDLPVAYPKQRLNRLLAEIISEQGIKQFHTAETEKYAHVTFFFNGGFETPYPGEDRKMIPSPKVATYDLQPEMSLNGVTCSILQALARETSSSPAPFLIDLTGRQPTEHVLYGDLALKPTAQAAFQIGNPHFCLEIRDNSLPPSASNCEVKYRYAAQGPYVLSTAATQSLETQRSYQIKLLAQHLEIAAQ